MATPSPQSSTLSNEGDSLDRVSRKLQHTPSPRKLKRLQSAQIDEQHSESTCKRCGWRYPIQNPNSRQRRQHKKICPKRSSIGSEEEIEGSGGQGGQGGPAQGESGGSTQTGDHELTDTAESRKNLFGEMEQEKMNEETGRAADEMLEQGPNEVPVREGGQPKQDSSKAPTYSGYYGSGTGDEKVEGFREKELGSQHIPEEPQAAHSARSEFDEEIGSDSGLSYAAGEHETDPSDDMGFDSSDIAEVAKREHSLPSDDDMLEEEKKYGAIQHKESLAHVEGDPGSNRPDSEGEGKPVNVADLITKYDKGDGSSSILPLNVTRNYIPLAGEKISIPSTKVGEAGQISLGIKDHKHGGDIIPTDEILEQGWPSSASGAEYDLEAILRKQKTHDLICPVCGSQITDRIIIKKKRTFSSKNEDPNLPNLTEVSSELSDQENNVTAITAESHGTLVERCFGYFGFFRRDS